jgi:AcrR family transcriptional regulator
MRNLAAAAKVSPTTLYNLYENKDVLILSALRDQLADVARRAKASPEDGFEYILRSRQAVAQQIIDTPKWAAAMTRLLFQAGPDDPITETLLTGAVADQSRALEVMRDAGQLNPDTDLESLGRTMVGANWSSILMWTKGLLPLGRLPDEYVRHGLLLLFPMATAKLKRRLNVELDKLGPKPRSRGRRSAS